MHWKTRFYKAKHSLGQAYNTSMKVLSVVDRAHALASKGLTVLGDRLEPEVRQKFDTALGTYGRRSTQIKNVDANLRQIGSQLKQSFPEYLA